MKYVPENKEECQNLNCKICHYYSTAVQECGYDGEDFGFDYDQGCFRQGKIRDEEVEHEEKPDEEE